jgi:hypothetical protein
MVDVNVVAAAFGFLNFKFGHPRLYNENDCLLCYYGCLRETSAWSSPPSESQYPINTITKYSNKNIDTAPAINMDVNPSPSKRVRNGKRTTR